MGSGRETVGSPLACTSLGEAPVDQAGPDETLVMVIACSESSTDTASALRTDPSPGDGFHAVRASELRFDGACVRPAPDARR